MFPRVECNDKVIKERIYSRHYQLSCNQLLQTIIEYLVAELAEKLSFFPAWCKVSAHFSSRMALHEENLDFDKYLEFALNECAQTLNHKKANNNVPRTLDSSCLCLNATK